MRQTRSVEIGTGLFVLLGMSSLFFLTTQTTGGDDFQAESVYTVEARFENIGSLRERAPVTMSGVTIGRSGFRRLGTRRRRSQSMGSPFHTAGGENAETR